MKTICICHSGRKNYFHQCLLSLQSNDLSGWNILIGCEPGTVTPGELFIIEGAPIKYQVNGSKLGTGLNQFVTMWGAISEGAEAILFVEDDVILSPDAVRLCNWYLGQTDFLDTASNSGLCLCTKLSDFDRPVEVSTTETWQGHVGQGYCFTRAMWFDFVKRNFWVYHDWFGGDGWDWALAHMALHLNKKMLRPRLSRSKHIGVYGVHGNNVEVFPSIISEASNTEFVIEHG